MNKISLWGFLHTFLSEAKNPKVLMFRVLTTFFILAIYMIASNPKAIVEGARLISREAILEQLEKEREGLFNSVAKTTVTQLMSQTRADLVYIAIYEPKFINSRVRSVVAEGTVNTNQLVRGTALVDKTGGLYLSHLSGLPFEVVVLPESVGEEGNFSFTDGFGIFRELGIEYIYTIPFFDLDNLYAGYVAVGWKSKPTTREGSSLPEYLYRITAPLARQLGRSM